MKRKNGNKSAVFLNKNRKIRSRNLNHSFRLRKGAIQLDFVIATGLFLLIFSYIVMSFNSYIAPMRAVVDVAQLRSEAETLRSLADNEFVPEDWPQSFADYNTVLLLRLDNSTNDT